MQEVLASFQTVFVHLFGESQSCHHISCLPWMIWMSHIKTFCNIYSRWSLMNELASCLPVQRDCWTGLGQVNHPKIFIGSEWACLSPQIGGHAYHRARMKGLKSFWWCLPASTPDPSYHQHISRKHLHSVRFYLPSTPDQRHWGLSYPHHGTACLYKLILTEKFPSFYPALGTGGFHPS